MKSFLHFLAESEIVSITEIVAIIKRKKSNIKDIADFANIPVSKMPGSMMPIEWHLQTVIDMMAKRHRTNAYSSEKLRELGRLIYSQSSIDRLDISRFDKQAKKAIQLFNIPA